MAISLKYWEGIIIANTSWSHIQYFWSFTKVQLRYHLPIWLPTSLKTLMTNLKLLSRKWPPWQAHWLHRNVKQGECSDSIATTFKELANSIGPHSWPHQLKIPWGTQVVLCENSMRCYPCCIALVMCQKWGRSEALTRVSDNQFQCTLIVKDNTKIFSTTSVQW